MNMSFALENQIQFLREKHTELYKRYGEGVSQLKIGSETESTEQIFGSAGKLHSAVRRSW